MLLFINASGTGNGHSKIIVPLSRIYDIFVANNKLVFNYENALQDDAAGNLIVKYKNENEVDQVLREFYKAVDSSKKVFYFGGNYSAVQENQKLTEKETSQTITVNYFDKAIEHLFS